MVQNFFELFDLNKSFDIDENTLLTAYQREISRFHPDRFSTSSESEQLQALQKTALINSAYSALKSPLNRAEYLLNMEGINPFDEKDTDMDSNFLLSQIELREDLEVIKEQKDSLALNDFIDRIKLFIKDKILSISDAFINLCDFKLATALVRELKFYEQLNRDANALMDEWL
jgi:molecular chaperone HscB